MLKQLSRLPGEGCRHWQGGRCLCEEHRNPGLDQGNVCAVIDRLGRAFDDFALRADNLGLPDAQAKALWQARFPALLAKEGNCQDYLPGDTTSFPDCAHIAGDLCLLALPPCPGRCRRFLTRHGA
ncbi:hypothetical protein [Solidesulfovibrio sp.]